LIHGSKQHPAVNASFMFWHYVKSEWVRSNLKYDLFFRLTSFLIVIFLKVEF
jgi:hypothetical protein